MKAWVVMTLAAAALAAAGCVNVQEPLVSFDASGLKDGGTKPDTRVKSTDSDEVAQLKRAVTDLQRKVSNLEEEAASEKVKRKAAERKLDDAEERIEKLEEQNEDLRKQLSKARDD